MSDHPDVGERAALDNLLRSFLLAKVPGITDLRIDGLVRLNQGFSRENWPFDATWSVDGAEERHALILRRDPLASVLQTSRLLEHEILTRMEHTAVPAPRSRWVDDTGEWFGRPSIILERHGGTCDWFVLEGGTLGYDEPTRLDVARQLCDLLASVHTVDWKAAGFDEILTVPTGSPALAELDHWSAVLDHQALEPHPELAEAASWLRHHAPEPAAVTLVHADFKPGNTLIEDRRVTLLLDWELAHLGDPVEDLGWVTNPVRRREHLIPGVWEIDDLLDRWESQTGLTADPSAVHWWRVFANYKLSIISLTGVRSYVDGQGDRVFTDGRNIQRILLTLIEAAP
ncbi:MAG: phosphotransferase family protein [Acidimicrobiales bacterium]|nr:phosphotransferase family protein [Acidimicrobiales bacterium]